jgi:hypothetical protein
VRSGAFGTLAFLNRSAMRTALAEAIAEYEIQGVTALNKDQLYSQRECWLYVHTGRTVLATGASLLVVI